MNVLGISGHYHDAAAALVVDGQVVAAAAEEAFSRVKHDPALPTQAIEYCLRAGGIGPGQLDAVAYHGKPITTFVRILRTHLQVAPRGVGTFCRAMPEWFRDKLWVGYEIDRVLRELGHVEPVPLHFTEHHESHAASAFLPSPFERAAVLTFDGVGEWATTSIGVGSGAELEIVEELQFPHSIGLLYAAFTEYCGFRVNSGEYKLMGLAPYGSPVYRARILDDLVELHDDGSLRLDLRYFSFLNGRRMTNRRFADLFDGPRRSPESEITQRHMDVARSIQDVTEEIVLRIARHAHEMTGASDVCLAGGVALNCVANGRLLREGPFERVWVQPASSDAGGALGAALLVSNRSGALRRADGIHDAMSGSALGPEFDDEEIASHLDAIGASYRTFADTAERARSIATWLDDGLVVALFLGRMEFGPRALGHRSIIADPRDPEMAQRLNERVKRRESFRPFAPAVLEESAGDWFRPSVSSPYMTLVTQVSPDAPSALPSVTHVDGSARVQTVGRTDHPEFHEIIAAFDALTGCPVVVNTSFNVRGEPIVCTPADAYRCFMGTDIDVLVLGSHVVMSSDRRPLVETGRIDAMTERRYGS